MTESKNFKELKEEVRKNTRWRRFQQWIIGFALVITSLWIIGNGIEILLNLLI